MIIVAAPLPSHPFRIGCRPGRAGTGQKGKKRAKGHGLFQDGRGREPVSTLACRLRRSQLQFGVFTEGNLWSNVIDSKDWHCGKPGEVDVQ
jgi:hypothetical protein